MRYIHSRGTFLAAWVVGLGSLSVGGLSAAERCDIRPDLPAETARRIVAACANASSESKVDDRERAERSESDLFRWLGRAHYSAKLADFVSTEIALTRPGVFEANPLMTHRAVRLTTLVTVPAATNWATSELYHDGRERLATIVRLVAVVLPTAFTVNNFLQ